MNTTLSRAATRGIQSLTQPTKRTAAQAFLSNPCCRRYASTATATKPESPEQHEPQPHSHTQPASGKQYKTLTETQRNFLASALRVNQAGELAATLIYTAQTPPVVKAHPHLAPLMKHMYDQEAGHFKTFNHLMAKHRVRPTALYPVWQLAATGLGWVTGVMGKEAAMACTEAVETEIGNHYNGQVRELFAWMQELKENGEELDPELAELIENVKRIRDEELEHLDHAVEHDAKEAQPYEPLTKVIQYGCRGAIWLSERV